MKKKLLVLSIFLLCFNGIFAQGKVRFGILGGLNYAGYGDISQIDINPKIAFLAGINSEFRINEKLLVTADLYFERKRSESDTYGFDFTTQRALYLIVQNEYLVLPLQVKFEFKKYDTFYLSGGIFTALLVNSYYHNGYGTEDDKFKKMDYGLCIGVGRAFNITPNSRLNLELRECLGVADISNSDSPYSSVNTNSLSLICNYSFDLK